MKRTREQASGVVEVEGVDFKANVLAHDQTADEESKTRPPCHKRLRTESYLQELQKFNETQKTMSFFQQGLMKIQKSLSTGASKHSLLQENLNKKWEAHEQQFQALRQRLLDNAQVQLDLENSIQCVRKQVEKQSNEASSPINLLHQGEETTHALFSMIEQFAGRPCQEEVLDCQQLMAIASTEC